MRGEVVNKSGSLPMKLPFLVGETEYENGAIAQALEKLEAGSGQGLRGLLVINTDIENVEPRLQDSECSQCFSDIHTCAQ